VRTTSKTPIISQPAHGLSQRDQELLMQLQSH